MLSVADTDGDTSLSQHIPLVDELDDQTPVEDDEPLSSSELSDLQKVGCLPSKSVLLQKINFILNIMNGLMLLSVYNENATCKMAPLYGWLSWFFGGVNVVEKLFFECENESRCEW